MNAVLYHSRFVLLLLSICIAFCHLATSHALPATPQSPSSGQSLQVHSSTDIERLISDYVRTLARHPRPQISGALMANLDLVVETRRDREYDVDPNLRHSSDIGDFNDIMIYFRYGEPPDRRLPTLSFRVQNNWPAHVDQWSSPTGIPDVEDFTTPFDWLEISRRMPLGRADALLKASGRREPYARVTLRQFILDGPDEPLQWCFNHLLVPGRGRKSFAVIVATEQVVEKQC
ncbi:MAG: hypothetical protein Q9169_005436 [Polycauliona sp. 2 TL-2023]